MGMKIGMKMRTHKRSNKGSVITGMLIASALLASGCSSAPSTSATGTTGTGQKDATAAPEKRGSISMSLYDRGSVPAEEGTIDNNRWTKYLNEKGPANIKYVPIPRFES